jgi:hypothetical protein
MIVVMGEAGEVREEMELNNPVPSPQSPIPNPQSPITSHQSAIINYLKNLAKT